MKRRQKTASILRYVGMGMMMTLTLTQLVPSLELASLAVWVGLANFFIVEAIAGVTTKESGLCFHTMGIELKNHTIWLLIGSLVCIQILYVVLGYSIFGQTYIDYDMGRTFDVINSDSIIKLLVIVPLSAWGEEIAWRGFFLARIYNLSATI